MFGKFPSKSITDVIDIFPTLASCGELKWVLQCMYGMIECFSLQLNDVCSSTTINFNGIDIAYMDMMDSVWLQLINN